jgi:hypothetical protein
MRTPPSDVDRLVERLARLAPQRRALLLALAPFEDDEGRFDRVLWVNGFGSDDPRAIVEVKAVTALYETIVNHLVEMLFAAARLRGLAIRSRTGRPSGPRLFDAVGADAGLADDQVGTLKRLYGTRNELQHASPGVEADQVFDDVQLLLRTLGGFVDSYVAWLKRHGVTITH